MHTTQLAFGKGVTPFFQNAEGVGRVPVYKIPPEGIPA
jgi:hypothetical protein